MKPNRIDLGSGVVVVEGEDSCLTVSSAKLALPWSIGSSDFPGTAVEWRDSLYEVRTGTREETGVERWLLAPWSGSDVIRTSDRLDAERIAALAEERRDCRRRQSLRKKLLYVLPFVGALPAAIQRRLQVEYNYPAGLGTVVSAGTEAFSAMVIFLAIRSGLWVPPPGFGWLLMATPFLFFEGAIRLAQSIPHGEPIGSILTLPALLLHRKLPSGPKPEDFRPRVVNQDDETGELQLATVEPRWDWQEEEILQFRERLYKLQEKTSRENRPLYRFTLVQEGIPTLKLGPPIRARRELDRGLGFIGSALRFTLSGFAPRDEQVLLVKELKLPVKSLTLLSAGFELFGGAVNLGQATVDDPLIIVDVFLVVEGSLRLILCALSGTPVGSVLGLPFSKLYQRWIREAKNR